MSTASPQTDERLDTGQGTAFDGSIGLLTHQDRFIPGTMRPISFRVVTKVVDIDHFHASFEFEMQKWEGPIGEPIKAVAIWDERGQFLASAEIAYPRRLAKGDTFEVGHFEQCLR